MIGVLLHSYLAFYSFFFGIYDLGQKLISYEASPTSTSCVHIKNMKSIQCIVKIDSIE